MGNKILFIFVIIVFYRGGEVLSSNARNVLDISWELPEPELANTPCEKDIQKLYANLKNMSLWAVEMWDASSKGPTGILQGSHFQMGNFGECVEPEDSGATWNVLPRQYCLAAVNILPPPDITPIKSYVEEFNPYSNIHDKLHYTGDNIRLLRDSMFWGFCAPASCRPKELETLLQIYFNNQSRMMEDASSLTSSEKNSSKETAFHVTILDNFCQKPEGKPFSTGALVFFWISGVSCGLMVIASVYHWFLIRRDEDADSGLPNFVQAYSAIVNLAKLGKKEMNGQGLDVLWGIRFISICFIVLDHRFGTIVSGAVSNREALEKRYHSITSVFLCHSDLLVDSFLVLSGLLCVYGLLRIYKDKAMNVPLIILHRFSRLIPAYAMVILCTAEVLPFLGSGPMWPMVVESEAEHCRQNWWTNIIMLNNYINTDKLCMVPSWYIPVDFHYFLVSLGICALLRMRSKVTTALLFICMLIVAALVVPGVITYYYRLPGTLLFFYEFLVDPRRHSVFQKVYITSHCRASPYFLGLLTGYVIVRYHQPGTKRLSVSMSVLGAVVALGVMLGAMASGTVFYEPSRPYSVLEASFYAALHRSVWAAALCLLILCCVFGHVPLISTLLSWYPWTPLGKLVYGAYLGHMMLQIRSLGLARHPYHIDPFTVVTITLGDIAFSFTISLLLYITIEGPTRHLINFLVYTKAIKKQEASISSEMYSSRGCSNPGADIENNEEDSVRKNNIHNIIGTFSKNEQSSEINKNVAYL